MTETAARDGDAGACRIGVIGAGYVGMPTAVVLANSGHVVVVAERDDARRGALQSGRSPMVEEGLEELLVRLQQSGRLRLVATAADAATDADVVFLCVATPTREDGRTDLRDVDRAVGEIRGHLKSGAIVVNRSTVPVGTADHVASLIGRDDVGVVSNPEFLREGRAVQDSFHPDRVVIGAVNPHDATIVADLFGDRDAPHVLTDPATAELIKYAANAYLAMKLSFINSMAQLCDALGTDVSVLARAVGLDPRVAPAFLTPGPGWGGSCLPKDVAALARIAEDAGVALPLVAATVAVNGAQIDYVVERCAQLSAHALASSVIGVLGLTFKAHTGDRRDSPALAVVAQLRARGATVHAFDPTVAAGSTDVDLAGAVTTATAGEAVRGVDVVVVLTEWPDFALLDWSTNPPSRDGATILDTRGVVDVAAATAAGWRVALLGRPSS